jgi:hypothetical protein
LFIEGNPFLLDIAVERYAINGCVEILFVLQDAAKQNLILPVNVCDDPADRLAILALQDFDLIIDQEHHVNV